MDIYIVQPGDTIDFITKKYGVSVAKLITDNGLQTPNDLIIGQTIVIVYPNQTYIVKDGDTSTSITDAFNITYMQLLRNNPFLSDRQYIYPGETLTISYDTIGPITTLGYAYPYIKMKTLIKTLPNLTYLSIFNYQSVEKGDIISYYDDTEIIQLSKVYGTVPIMMITTITLQGEQNVETAFSILNSEEYQEKTITNILNIMKDKGYLGLNMSIRYLKVSNQELYNKFIKKVSSRLREEGFLYFITLNPNIESVNDVISFEEIDFTTINQAVDKIIILQLIWGTNSNPPAPVSNISSLRQYLDYIVTMVPPEKIIVGKTVMSYDWQLPYIPGITIANSLTIDSALDLTRNAGDLIQFDEISQTPFFIYNQINIGPPFEHIVWSMDARSINALEKTYTEYSLNGIAIWNIMVYYPQLWLLINSQYDTIKYLPFL